MLRALPVLLPVALGGATAIIAAAATLIGSPPDARALAGLAALLAAAIVAEALPLPLEGVAVGRTSLATIFVVAAATLYGWAPATILAALAMASVELGRRRPASRIAFNTGVYALGGAAAGGAASLVGADAAATAVGAVAFYAVDIGLLAALMARLSGEEPLRVLGRFVAGTAAPFAIMASVAVTLVVLWSRSPFFALLLAGPLAALVLYERRMHDALERLRELDRLKSEFIAVVSHELRTPLAAVYGAAMTLQRRRLTDAERESMLGIVYRESDRLARLVDQVLWASRLESGRADVLAARIDAVRLAGDVVAVARAHLPEHHTLELDADPATPPAMADQDKVRQVLVNLVENAVKYSPDGGRVEVRLRPASGHVRFTVADEGLGIPAAEHARIFDKFHRLDPHLTRGVGGTGLGLYICRELVERMDGRIWVESEPGRGSAFSFELPRA